ncbi:MAG: hypothetical protein U1E34_12435 [Amaricoccus sp.]
MGGDKVADICLHGKDLIGEPIEAVYSKVSATYAVYGTPKRIMVQFADDPSLGVEQRRALAPLNPLRGQINGLLDGWRQAGGGKDQRVRIFDRRTADALTVALQGDQAHAETLLEGVKADILEEQESLGRVDYLINATICAVVVFVGFMLISAAKATGQVPNMMSSFIEVNKIWLAAAFGSLGALFSIALGIRSREVRPDLQRRDNIVDAILRIMIGVVSAIMLFSLLRSQLVSLGFGAGKVNFGTGGPEEVHLAIVVAFVAGFSERMVGDYISRVTLGDRSPASASTAAAQQQASREADANELNPRGRSELASAPGVAASAAAPVAAEPHDHEAGTDGCVCDAAIAPEEVTGDDELPEATGGVDKAAA